jgi:hypothetical protein
MGQNVFNMVSGGTREMMSDLERRKFTAEEGVGVLCCGHGRVATT